MKARLIFLLSIFSPFICLAKVDPDLKYYRIQSEHFELIYNAKQSHLGKLVLDNAEKAYINLQSYFRQFPEKTLLVLDSSVDLANGSATVFPYPVIYLYHALPTYESSIGDYQDWVYELILHEYVHILNLYPQEGSYHYLKYIFGSLARPNLLLPRWHLEGLAVAIESEASNGGRLRSSYYEAYARNLSKNDLWSRYTLVETNETGAPYFPYGDRPYYYGALFWNHLLESHEKQKVADFVENNATRVPYFHNRSLKATFDTEDQTNYRAALKYSKEKAQNQIEQIGALPTIPSLIKNSEEQEMFPSIQKDQLAYVSLSPHRDAELRIWPEFKPVATGTKFLNLNFHPQLPKLLYTKAATYNRYYFVYDLYEYNLETKKTETLTQGKSLREASYSPSGEILALYNQGARDEIAKYHHDSKTWETVYQAPLGNRLQNPRFWRQNQVLFLEKNSSGHQTIQSLSLATKEKKQVFGFLTEVSYLQNSLDRLYFISSHTGRTKIYQSSKDLNRFYPIQDSHTKILDFAISDNEKILYFTELDANGYKLKQSSIQRIQGPEKRIEGIYPLHSKVLELSSAQEYSSAQDYSSTSYLLPRYWMPWIYSTGESAVFQASTSASDPLAKQSYSAAWNYDTHTKASGLQFQYLNQMLPVNWYVGTSTDTDLLLGSSDKIETRTTQIGLQSFIWKLSNDWTWNLNLRHTKSKYTGQEETKRTSANGKLLYNSLAGLKGNQLAPTKGNYAKVGVENYFSEKDKKAFQIGSLQWQTYFPSKNRRFHNLRWNVKIDKRSNNTSSLAPGYLSAGGYNFSAGDLYPHLVRGYPQSEFLAWSMISQNLEYYLPFKYLYKDTGDAPVYLNKLFLKFSLDSMMMDGKYYYEKADNFQRDRWNTPFHSVGFEFQLDTQIGYYLPMQFSLGAHYGFFKKSGGGKALVSLYLSLPSF